MRGKRRSGRWAILPVLLMMTFGAVLSGCSTTTRTQTLVVAPPESLLMPCSEAETSPAMLEALRRGDSRAAATEYVGYVLRVREAHDMCAGKVEAIRAFYQGLREAVDDGR